MTRIAEDASTEQRRGARANVHGFVECQGPAATVRRELADISVGGMFIDSHPTPFRAGDVLKLRFQASRDELRLGVQAEVLYVQEGIGMGVRFLDLGPEERERIESCLQRATSGNRSALRKSSRVHVTLPAALRVPGAPDDHPEEAQIVTLSKYGACIETTRTLEVGTRIVLVTRSGLEFKGNVVWLGRAQTGELAQAGVQCRGLAQALGFRFP